MKKPPVGFHWRRREWTIMRREEELRHEVEELQHIVHSYRLILRQITNQQAALIEEAEALLQIIERSLAAGPCSGLDGPDGYRDGIPERDLVRHAKGADIVDGSLGNGEGSAPMTGDQ
jgi:hypothetical protein